MKLLIIGGTRFLGRAIVEAGLAVGHELTLFNRGQSNKDLFPSVEQLIGDRDGGLDVLAGRRWDAVIDTCGYFPRLVRESAELLSDVVAHYTFISTLSVYAEPGVPGMDESAPLDTIEDETIEEITGESYGPLKALCETAVTDAMNGQALHVRSGLIVGPHDVSDRFNYWPVRVAKGGEVLAPGDPNAPVQFIDVRDIAEWTLRATEAGLTGPYNIAGPVHPLRMDEVLEACRHVSGGDASFSWVSEQFLLEHEVAAYTEMPLWLPAEYTGLSMVNCRKAIKDGLVFRALDDTIRDTLAWHDTRPPDYEWRSGLSADREKELLDAWHELS